MYERNQIGKIGLWLRNAISFTGRFGFFIRIIRLLYVGFSKTRNFEKILTKNRVDVLFATSLTNFIFDAQLVLAAKRIGIPTLGTVRSWDNLVSHGSLRTLPDLFLNHSKYMRDCALKYQHVRPRQMAYLGTSTYIKNYRDESRSQHLRRRFIFGCVGPSNPAEIEMITDLVGIMDDLKEAELIVLEHPKFKHSLPPGFAQNKRIGFNSFSFEDTASDQLSNYYNYLKSVDFLITSGSTVGLDSLFVGTPVVMLFYEPPPGEYWASSMRFLTHRTHYKDFIRNTKVPVFKSFAELRAQLFDYEKFVSDLQKDLPKVDYFTGSTSENFYSNFLKALKLIS
jgi:hypothetical protein